MAHGAGEPVHGGETGDVAFRGEASGDNEEACFGVAPVGGLDVPFPGGLVELGRGDDGAEGAVFAELKGFVDVIEVGLKLVPVGVTGRIVSVACPDRLYTYLVVQCQVL